MLASNRFQKRINNRSHVNDDRRPDEEVRFFRSSSRLMTVWTGPVPAFPSSLRFTLATIVVVYMCHRCHLYDHNPVFGAE
ncbi:hypothetical protein V1264_013367 [Littorina saxatilis]|uniref:Uncharacterized protein n=1 Tax=Littorina saxatilis TaxID=31220 RepID=A0AAN9GIH5_9CAEN